MLALPDGPVAALDLSSGASVSLTLGPPGAEPAELEARIARWNALALDGCPVVADLRWQLGRPLISCEPLRGRPPRPPLVLERPLLVARAAALGAALDAADLGLAVGAVDLAVGPLGVCLRRPAVWPADPERPLARSARRCRGAPARSASRGRLRARARARRRRARVATGVPRPRIAPWRGSCSHSASWCWRPSSRRAFSGARAATRRPVRRTRAGRVRHARSRRSSPRRRTSLRDRRACARRRGEAPRACCSRSRARDRARPRRHRRRCR